MSANFKDAAISVALYASDPLDMAATMGSRFPQSPGCIYLKI
jgi:hypothetical protein